MNSIIIDLQEKDGHFAARAVWGMSTWHRDPISAVSELFGQALPFALQFANEKIEAYPSMHQEVPHSPA